MREKSAWLRRELFEMVVRQGKGHLPSCFSCVDILVALYYGGIKYDKVIVSKGHAAMALYPILADLGHFPKQELERFTHGLLGMYADTRIPGIEAMSGSLGHGLGIGAGMALAGHRTFVVLGDGECYEGSVWEAAMFAAHHRLGNLTAIVDRNNISILGETETLLELGDLEEKFRAFGWASKTIDGHSHAELVAALSWPDLAKPLAIIANTVKGKGLSFMENDSRWHGNMPSDEQIEIARAELC